MSGRYPNWYRKQKSEAYKKKRFIFNCRILSLSILGFVILVKFFGMLIGISILAVILLFLIDWS